MEVSILSWLNSWNGSSGFVDLVVFSLQTTLLKGMPFMLVFWALWFWPKMLEHRTGVREALTAALVCTVPIMGLTRTIANYAPYSPRPIHVPEFELELYPGQSVMQLNDWSSMPSDHASLFLGFAVAIFTIHRTSGFFLILWAIFAVSIPRIIVGLHWPSDILVGWLLGASLALFLIGPGTRLVRRASIVPYFEAREMIGYPLLFLATFEFTRMFSSTRELVAIILP